MFELQKQHLQFFLLLKWGEKYDQMQNERLVRNSV